MPKLSKSNRQFNKRISTEWFHGLDPTEHEQLEKSWRNSTYVLDRLKGIVERRLNELELDREDDYNNPQWPVLRADRNGQLKALKKIFNLLP